MPFGRKWADMAPDLVIMVAAVRATLFPPQCADGIVRYEAEDRY
jgi:hypothetical protein